MKEDSAWRRRERGDLYLKYTHTKEIHCYSDATAFCILILDNLSPTTSLSLLFLARLSQKKVAFRKESIHIENAKSQKKLFCPPNIVFLVCMFEGT